jgi:hypothetical protein
MSDVERMCTVNLTLFSGEPEKAISPGLTPPLSIAPKIRQ